MHSRPAQVPEYRPRRDRRAARSAAAATLGRAGDEKVNNNVREHLERILASYEDINTRFSGVGGVSKLLSLFEEVKRELDRVSEQELERVTGEIKGVVEALLKVDYELRKVQNLKLLFEQRSAEDVAELGNGGS